MKKMRKFASVMLAVIMALALAVPAFAASGDIDNTKGKITIDNAVPAESYSIYRIFDLKSYSEVEGTPSEDGTHWIGNFSYVVADDAWKTFINSATFKKDGVDTPYIILDANGYIQTNNLTENNAADFAKDALDWATTHSIAAEDTKTAPDAAEGETTSEVVFSDLTLGYYLVDSSLGTLCSLNTTASDVIIKEKNESKADLDKEIVKDDGTESKDNVATIGDDVSYKLVVTVDPTIQGYEVTDTMDAGLDYNEDIAIKVDDAAVPTNNYTLTNTDNGFKVVFDDTWITGHTEVFDIVITYSAKITADAAVNTALENNADLKYGNDQHINTNGKTRTYVYEFDLVKYDGHDRTLLGDDGTNGNGANAQFTLSKNADGSDPVTFTYAGDVYTVAENGTVTTITVYNGQVQIKGLDLGDYYLTEIKAPDGYNLLTSAITVKVSNTAVSEADQTKKVQLTYSSKTVDGDASVTNGTLDNNSAGLTVENNTGTVLPETGGIGTTIFYVVGGCLAIGAAILLVTKKRMAK